MTIPLRLSAIGLPAFLLSSLVHASFIEEMSSSLEFKNYYIHRDYPQSSGQTERAEWAQGFLLRLDSGFTEGPIGFGVDTLGMYGLKLDSSPSRSNTGLLPREDEAAPGAPNYARRAEDDYAKFGIAAKMRVAESELRYGDLEPAQPTLRPNTSRLFPQTFRGFQITSNDIDDLELTAGLLSRTRQRDATHYEDLSINRKGGAYTAADSQRFQFVGGNYRVTNRTRLGYQFAQLEDIYQQHYLGVSHSLDLGEGRLGMDLRYFSSDEAGAASAGEVDNRAASSRLRYRLNGHAWSGGYQEQFGSTPFAYVNGTTAYLFSQMQFSNFTETGQRVWHARYDYDFTGIGVPGLTFTARYATGDNATVAGFDGEGREWERDLDVEYILQSGPLKGMSLRWRNAVRRANFSSDIDENRLMVGYVLPL